MSLRPVPPNRLRLLLLAGGLVVFFWMRLEDHGVAGAVLMSVLLTALILLAWLWPRLAARTWTPRTLIGAWALTGAGAGLLTVVITILLMLLKNGFHGHLNPDYPTPLMASTLALAPAWALAGALIGVGAALLAVARAR